MRKIDVLVFSTILVYVIFHITEEAVGNFPLFINQNWGIPNIGYSRWLYHNIIFFLPVLLVGFLLYLMDEKRLFFGLGITFWGVLNSFEHLFYSIKNLAVSPGSFSSILFVVLAAIIIYELRKHKKLTGRLMTASILTTAVYWGISLRLVMLHAQQVALIFA